MLISLDFCPASLKSLGSFYFRCILSLQRKAVTVNSRILHCQLQRHFWRPVVRMCLVASNNLLLVLQDAPKNFFSSFFLSSFFSTNSRSSDLPKNDAKTLFSTLHPLSTVILQLQQWWHLYCFAILGSTSTVIHSVKQRLLRNRPGSDAATSRDFMRDRLQRAFTRANQLH